MFFRYRWALKDKNEAITAVDDKIAHIDAYNDPSKFIEDRKELIALKQLILKIYRLKDDLENILKVYQHSQDPKIKEQATAIAHELDQTFQAFMTRPLQTRMMLSALVLFIVGMTVLTITYSYAHLTENEKGLAIIGAVTPGYILFFTAWCAAHKIALCYTPAQKFAQMRMTDQLLESSITENPLYQNNEAVETHTGNTVGYQSVQKNDDVENQGNPHFAACR